MIVAREKAIELVASSVSLVRRVPLELRELPP